MTMHSSFAPASVTAGSFEVTSLQDGRRPWLRRAAFVVPVAACTLAGTALATVATAEAGGMLRPVLLALVAVNILYMALTGWPMLLGFLLHLFGRRMKVAAMPMGESRTALLMPVYNENPSDVFAAMEAMGRAVAEAGLQRVDLFVLSDTRDESIALAEQAEFERVQARLPPGPALFYRRRADNSGRKVGNLLDFCKRWGDSYDYMLVLDADSLMGARTISTLIGLMDGNPKAGIIQTVPYAVGRQTPFARFLQFSARLYTPLLIDGLTFWQGGDGNYWGHNAIVRIAPFVEHCALPVLPGREPFGGEILCHDVVEAGLMRAAGWHVWVLPQMTESFEAVPANLVDFTGRERRWCQGNLQHVGVLSDRRLRPVGRFHLAYGVLHYLAAPAAFALLGLATIDSISGGGFADALLGPGLAQAWLIGLGAVLLYGGKLAVLLSVLVDGDETRGFGGRMRLLAGAVAEQLGALVISAVLITFYTRFIGALLAGASVRWDAQPRDDRGLSWSEAADKLRLPTLVGVVWLALLTMADRSLLMWSLPLLGGLLLSIPAAYLSSRAAVGRDLRRLGLFLTPEEHAPAPVLRAYQLLVRPGERMSRPKSVTPGLQLVDADSV
ncbi:MAG: glucans biosynthesis glucosyltransferase MdoH [Acetobacteraceae bacterium]|nr:glucans biosynthesis glucosyltransferase MdoH [Acetobacteraceae bacterium]